MERSASRLGEEERVWSTAAFVGLFGDLFTAGELGRAAGSCAAGCLCPASAISNELFARSLRRASPLRAAMELDPCLWRCCSVPLRRLAADTPAEFSTPRVLRCHVRQLRRHGGSRRPN